MLRLLCVCMFACVVVRHAHNSSTENTAGGGELKFDTYIPYVIY